MTATIPDIDLDRDTNLDDRPVCECEDCQDDATHTLTVIKCGCMMLICTPHALQRARSAWYAAWYCRICSTTLGVGYNRNFIRITPL